jgi:hypothetical protein
MNESMITQKLQSGIQFMYDKHGRTEGHVCGDCKLIARHPRINTICACKEYQPVATLRPENMVIAYERGEAWRGHWQACGLWQAIVKKAKKNEDINYILDMITG